MNLLFSRWKRWKTVIIVIMVFVLTLVSIGLLVPEVTVAGVPIFGFHNIYDPNRRNEQPHNRSQVGLEYPLKNIEEFLDYIAGKNYWTLTVKELDDHFIAETKREIPLKHLEQKPIAITFDDGYKTIHTRLLPILEALEKKYQRKLTVILFVNGGFLGKRGVFLEHMSCDDLRDGFQRGFYDIQSHTLNHKKLTTLSLPKLDHEFSEDQIRLRRCIGNLDGEHRVAKYVAYPFGADNAQVDRSASHYFSLGFLYNGAILRLGHHLNKTLGGKLDRYRIPRLAIGRDVPVERLKKLASGSARLESLLLHIDEHELWSELPVIKDNE